MKRIICMALFLCAAPALICAATLEDLQKSAMGNRDIVKKFEADVKFREAQVKERRGDFLPTADVSYALTRLDRDGITGESKENDNFRVGLGWNVFAGFTDKYNLKATESLLDVGKFNLASTRQDIGLNVALFYLEQFRRKSNLAVSENELKLYRDRYRQVKLKYDVGVLKKSDLLRIKVEMDNAIQKERRAQADVEAGLNLLSLETGRDVSDELLDFSIFELLPEKMDYSSYEAAMLGNRSDIKALGKVLEAAGYKVQASRGDLYPRADLSLGYTTKASGDYFIGSPSESDDELRFQAKISLNIFDGFKKYARTGQARMTEKKAKHDLKELENSLKTSLKNNLLDLDVAFDNLMVAKSGKAEAEENVRITDLAFEQGLSTSADVLDSIFNVSRAGFNLIDARAQVFRSHFRVMRLVEGM